MGDCYALVADSILTLAQPFPGDGHYDSPGVVPELRFDVKRLSSIGSYSIFDRLVEERVILAESLLREPQFDLGRWYAVHRSRAWGLDKRVPHHGAMFAM